MVGLVSALYKIARIANDVRKLSSGNAKRMARSYPTKPSVGAWFAG